MRREANREAYRGWLAGGKKGAFVGGEAAAATPEAAPKAAAPQDNTAKLLATVRQLAKQVSAVEKALEALG